MKLARMSIALLLLTSVSIGAQTSKTVTASGPCSVAIIGNGNIPTINCGNISKEDAQKLAEVLNSIQKSNVSLDTLVTRIDDLIAQLKNRIDPNRAVITYDFQGNRRMESPGRSTFDSKLLIEAFNPMMTMQNEHRWNELLKFTQEQKLKTPEWLTPIAFEGLAYLNLCERDKALQDFYEFRDKAKDYPAYETAMPDVARFIASAEQQGSPCRPQTAP